MGPGGDQVLGEEPEGHRRAEDTMPQDKVTGTRTSILRLYGKVIFSATQPKSSLYLHRYIFQI